MGEIILRLGAEGGSLRLLHQDGRFALEKDESGTHALLDEDDREGLPPAVSRSKWGTWREALVQLDRYPWLRMTPLFVHSEYKRHIAYALRKRGMTDTEEFFAFALMEASLEWRAHLARFIARSRAQKPIPDRESLTPAEEHQCRIIGGALINWLEEQAPAWIADRNAHARIMPFAFKPLKAGHTIVLTLDQPGLVAANEILESKPSNILFLSEPQYRRFKKTHPDDAFEHHILHTSRIVVRPVQLDGYPIEKGEEFWIHEEGTILGRRYGRGITHLWKWDGHEPTLLKEGYGGWVS